MSRSPTLLPVEHIPSLAVLFKPLPRDSKGATPGFPRRSTLLVSGRAGSGKSFFALSLARELMRHRDLESSELYFITLQTNLEQLGEKFQGVGWFTKVDDKTDPVFTPNRVRLVSVNETDLPQPTRGAEELVNPILTKVRYLQAPPHTTAKDVIVLVDPLTALVKDSQSLGDRRRNVSELVTLLKVILGGRLALCILTADVGENANDLAVAEDETVADFVFRLGFRDTGGGRLSRELNVRKCPESAPMLLGKHSWEVLTPANLKEVFAYEGQRENRRKMLEDPRNDSEKVGWVEERKGAWGTVAIIPHPRLPAIGNLQDWEGGDNATGSRRSPLFSGVPGLDEMLAGDGDYWARSTQQILAASNDEGRGLYPGSTTFLLGRAGTGKTICSLQFLLAHKDNLDRCLYVNFENRPHRVREWYPGSENNREALARCKQLYRRRAQLDVNLLINELSWIVRNDKIERIVFDGLSDLTSVLDQQEYSQLVEELIVCVREANFQANEEAKQKATKDQGSAVSDHDAIQHEVAKQKATKDQTAGGDAQKRAVDYITIYISLESDLDAESISRYQSYSFADNVLVLRQVVINDEQRKTIEVVKARGQAPDRQLRELVFRLDDEYPVRVVPGLDNYRQVAGGRPEPVRVALQLISENPMAERCNQLLTTRLRSLFGYSVRQYGFSRGEIARTLLDIASGIDRIPFSDVKLLHVDEWWIRELRVKGGWLGNSKELFAERRHPLLRLNHFLLGSDTDRNIQRFPSDFWAIEMDKACVPVLTRSEEYSSNKLHFRADVVVLPSYADYGIFCVNARLLPRAPQHNPGTGEKAGTAGAGLGVGGRPECKGQGTEEKGGTVGAGQDKQGRQNTWQEILDEVPRVWCRLVQRDSDRGWWFEHPQPEAPSTVVDVMKQIVTNKDKPTDAPLIGFCFDMETPATAACTFLELCWAFGATEEVFIQDVCSYAAIETHSDQETFLARHPATLALQFLMFLVIEDLMPTRTTLRDAKRAVFSRHWYSSIPWVDPAAQPSAGGGSGCDQAPANMKGADWFPQEESPKAKEARIRDRFLYPLPFFPLGDMPTDSTRGQPAVLLLSLQDAITRFSRLIERLEATVAYRTTPPDGIKLLDLLKQSRGDVETVASSFKDWVDWRVTANKPVPGGDSSRERLLRIVDVLNSTAQKIKDNIQCSNIFALGIGEELRRQTPPGFDPADEMGGEHWRHFPYAIFMDIRDVLEFFRWHEFRMRLIAGALQDKPPSLSSLIGKASSDTGNTKVGHDSKPLTGYACEGSWMIGVDRTTRSPTLAAKFVLEIASLQASVSRAQLGAGIPARKDFYDYYGNSFVPCFPEADITWSELLRFLGSRSRCRTRSFCARLHLSAVFEAIDRQMFHCLTLSGELRRQYELNVTTDPVAIKKLQEAARSATRQIFDMICNGMKEQARVDFDNSVGAKPEYATCVTCPTNEACKKLITPTIGAGGNTPKPSEEAQS